MSQIRSAALEDRALLPSEAIVVVKSTVPVGTTRLVEEVLARADVWVASNPEFHREGSAVHDFLHPDRVVIGCDDNAAAFRVASLFDPLRAQMLLTDPASAETIKYASNAFLATKVSFVNAIANVCDAVGADVRDVLLGMSHDKRIGSEFMSPGPGYGGSRFPKDVAALIRMAEEAGYSFGLLRGVTEVNVAQFERVAGKVVTAAGGSVKGVTVAAWGLSFKARTADLGMSPALEVIERLRTGGAHVRAHDPGIAVDCDDPSLEGIELCADPYGACEGAAVLVVLTEWEEFRRADFAKVHGLMVSSPQIVDARNLLDPTDMRRHGFHYTGMGR